MRIWTIPTVSLFIFLVAIFLTRFTMLGQAIYGDGIYYWAYTHSVVLDQNFDLRDEAGHEYSPVGNNSNESGKLGNQLTDNKYYPLGASLTWIPAFVLADLLAKPLGYTPNGYSDIYQIAVGVLNISFVIVGMMLLWNILTKHYSRFTSLMSMTLMILGTNLFYYSGIDVLNTHPSSFLLCTLAVYFLFAKKPLTNKILLLQGIIVGLCALIRPQDGLFAILFLPEIIKSRRLSYLFIFAFGGFLAYTPQLIMSQAVFGNVTTLPYLGKDAFYVFSPHLVELVFDRTRGLLYYCPIYLVGLAGLIIYTKKKRVFGARLLILVTAEIILISVWSGWAQGESYGMRMLIGLLPILVLGLCEVINILQKYLSKNVIVFVGMLFILQNFLLITAFHVFLHEPTFVHGELSKGGKMKQEILLKLSEAINR